MNELEFCIVALTMLVLCNLMLIGWLNRRIKQLDNFVGWDHQNSIDGILGRLETNEHHLDNIDELLCEMLTDHEPLVRHHNMDTIKNAEWFDVDRKNAIGKPSMHCKRSIKLILEKFDKLHPSVWRKQTDDELHNSSVIKLGLDDKYIKPLE